MTKKEPDPRALERLRGPPRSGTWGRFAVADFVFAPCGRRGGNSCLRPEAGRPSSHLTDRKYFVRASSVSTGKFSKSISTAYCKNWEPPGPRSTANVLRLGTKLNE